MEIKIDPFYVTLEVATLLKKEGFDLEVNSYSVLYDDTVYYGEEHNYNIKDDDNKASDLVSRPETWLVLEWFKLKYNIIIYSVLRFEPNFPNTIKGWTPYIHVIKDNIIFISFRLNLEKNIFNTQQESDSFAIKYAIEKYIYVLNNPKT